MAPELYVLALSAVLLVVHVQVAIRVKTRDLGTAWNVGARDHTETPADPVVGRLERARDNFLETLPIAIIALFGVVVAGKTSALTEIAGWTWLAARAIYLPLYWKGVPVVRTVVWAVGTAAILAVLAVLLLG